MSSPARLNETTLWKARSDVSVFGYDRTAQGIGIVHFGIGAFHRAHQAWYTDRAMAAGDRDWAIAGVSLRSAAVAEQLNPQDGLYSVSTRSAQASDTHVVGAVREVLVAARQAAIVAALIARGSTRIVSLTVTEKGYARAADGSLDPALAGANSIYPLLARGLRQRRDEAAGGLTLLSCDNLAGNGAQLARLISEWCQAHDPELGRWIADACTFPSTMVDRIVPATTPADLDTVAALLGLRDEGAVLTEGFSQWVIEDRFAAGRPAWDAVGAELVADVAPYETAKLRMLNGAHSALAYLGLARGHVYVHQAIGDPKVRADVERLMRHEAAPSLTPAPGQDLSAYADLLIERFANRSLQHRLAQIASDGSQKLPQRWLETLADAQRSRRECPAILTALAAWLLHVRGDDAARGPVDDPVVAPLRQVWQRAGVGGIVDAIFGTDGLIRSAWRPTDDDRAALTQHLNEELRR